MKHSYDLIRGILDNGMTPFFVPLIGLVILVGVVWLIGFFSS